MTWLAVAIGAGIGAPLRYLVEVYVHNRRARVGAAGFPVALLVVNVVGSTVAGVVATVSPIARAGILIGFCGALTTYSGFGAHLDRQWRANRRGFWITLVGMPVACIAAFVLGLLLTRVVTGR